MKPPSIIMEYVENGNLREYLRSKGTIPDIVTRNIVAGIANGMHHLVILAIE